MEKPPNPRLRRRGVLGIPALAVAATTILARPAAAEAAPSAECVADLITEDLRLGRKF